MTDWEAAVQEYQDSIESSVRAPKLTLTEIGELVQAIIDAGNRLDEKEKMKKAFEEGFELGLSWDGGVTTDEAMKTEWGRYYKEVTTEVDDG